MLPFEDNANLLDKKPRIRNTWRVTKFSNSMKSSILRRLKCREGEVVQRKRGAMHPMGCEASKNSSGEGNGFTMVESPENPTAGRIAIMFVMGIFFLLSALTSALPTLDNLALDESSGESIDHLSSGDIAWLLTCSALVLLMTPGVAFFYGGLVNSRNIISTMCQSFVAMGIVSVLWTIVGFSLAFGRDANGSGVLGYPRTYYMYNNVGAKPEATLAPSIPLSLFSLFQLMFAVITPTLISGSLAERLNFNSWMVFVCIWHLVVYCPLAHMTWSPGGALRKWGVIDFAGGLVVEMSSGCAALAGAYFLGPRQHRTHTPGNIPFVLLGTALFWFGWLGFNGGSAMAADALACQAFATTNVAAAAGMLTWIFVDLAYGSPASALGACNGIVTGLVAITPACGYVTVGSAMCIAVVANLVCYHVAGWAKRWVNIDDSLDVFAVHGVGGAVGFLCTAVFTSSKVNAGAPDGLVYGHGVTLGKHVAVVLVAVPCLLISSFACFYVTSLLVPMRVTRKQEALGLDRALHHESIIGHEGGDDDDDGGSGHVSPPSRVNKRDDDDDNDVIIDSADERSDPSRVLRGDGSGSRSEGPSKAIPVSLSSCDSHHPMMEPAAPATHPSLSLSLSPARGAAVGHYRHQGDPKETEIKGTQRRRRSRGTQRRRRWRRGSP